MAFSEVSTLSILAVGDRSRHFFWLYLGGAMARSSWSREEALQFHAAIVSSFHTFGDHDEDIKDSFERHGKGEPVAGLDEQTGLSQGATDASFVCGSNFSISSMTRFIFFIVRSSGSSAVISTPASFSKSIGYFDPPAAMNFR